MTFYTLPQYFIPFRPCFFALLIQSTKLHIVIHSLFSTLLDNLTETMTHLNVQFKLYSFLTHIALRCLPRVFTNNPSYLAYVTEGNIVTLSLRFCSQVSARTQSYKKLLYQVSSSALRPLPWEHRILGQAVILSFLIIVFLIFLISLGEMS